MVKNTKEEKEQGSPMGVCSSALTLGTEQFSWEGTPAAAASCRVSGVPELAHSMNNGGWGQQQGQRFVSISSALLRATHTVGGSLLGPCPATFLRGGCVRGSQLPEPGQQL